VHEYILVGIGEKKMIWLTGDTHGDYDIRKLTSSNFPEGTTFTKQDYMIILGDFGLVWKTPQSNAEKYWLKWLDDKEWTTLVVPGNHENWDLIPKLPQVNMFGNRMYKVSETVFMFKRGEVYNIDGQKFFVMGGAYSVDKHSRTKGHTWWSREEPTINEFEHGLCMLECVDWKVDYILGHTCPEDVGETYLASMGLSNQYAGICTVQKFFNVVVEKTEFKRFYFGHWHDDWNVEIQDKQYTMMYDKIEEIKDWKQE